MDESFSHTINLKLRIMHMILAEHHGIVLYCVSAFFNSKKRVVIIISEEYMFS